MRPGHDTAVARAEVDHSRQRRFHRRSRNGCQQCKARRVRCDEGRPICGNCSRKSTEQLCIYKNAAEASTALNTESSITPMTIPQNSPTTQNSLVPFVSQDFDWSVLISNLLSAPSAGLPLSNYPPLPFNSLLNQQASLGSTSLHPNDGSQSNELSSIHLQFTNNEEDPYQRQMRLLQHPDELAKYFASEEQRQLFHHFVNEAASDLLVIPTTHSNNPWLVHLSPLALLKPAGQDLTHDALRAAILSLASLDIGTKMNIAIKDPHNNAMYTLSEAQRSAAMKLLDMGNYVEAVNNDLESADLTVATAVILAVRDRLGGHQSWEAALVHGVRAVTAYNGPAGFLGKNVNPSRRFLVEQMACAELLGAMTNSLAPKLLQWDNDDWLMYDRGGRSGTGIRVGQFCGRAMILGDESRQLNILKRDNAQACYTAVSDNINVRKISLSLRSGQLSDKIIHVRSSDISLVLPTRAAHGINTALLCAEIALLVDSMDYDAAMYDDSIQSKVQTVLDIVDEAFSQGMYSGFLMPLIWMAVSATALPNRPESHETIDAIQMV
ncbi:uncharacterized protein L201_006994 [Kwoniella dendrophila CBS 6074]|uniref:Zn(2)-C6 fungal-type domain-containing protein n=1 Tax=Kwoniella dendrophila CBS 6074 TaxID=1295534 RepID=A0AAX4K5G4_9TREE